MSDEVKDTPDIPPPLHEGKLYTIEHDHGLSDVLCDGEVVLSALALLASEIPVLERMVYVRNEVDGPEPAALDLKLGEVADRLCAPVEARAARAICYRLRFLGWLAEGVDAEGIILHELKEAWKPQPEPEGGDR